MLERVKSVRVQESFDFRDMKMNLRTPYTGRVDDRFAGARCEDMGARRSVLFDRLRLPATCHTCSIQTTRKGHRRTF